MLRKRDGSDSWIMTNDPLTEEEMHEWNNCKNTVNFIDIEATKRLQLEDLLS